MDKQIEELAKVLCPSYENKKDCETCPTEWCQAEEYAAMAICNGYRKIAEDVVVLETSVYESLEIKNYRDVISERVRKETAEKYHTEINKAIESVPNATKEFVEAWKAKNDEICKELEGEK